jgi:hypothetical protein
MHTNENRFYSLSYYIVFSSFQYALRTSNGLKTIANPGATLNDPSCTSNRFYRLSGVRLCLALNPFRSIELGSRPTYPITVCISMIRSNVLSIDKQRDT